MKISIIVGLLIVLIVCSCSQHTSKDEQQTENGPKHHLKSKTGLKIEYGPNIGNTDTYTLGHYICITATITNVSTIPIHLNLALSKEYDYPDSCGVYKYKVFLLPKELTPDTAALYNNITDGIGDFLERCLDNPYILNKTLKPGEYSVVTIGILLPRSGNCAALPRAVFVQGDDNNFQECDSRMNQDKSTNPQLVLGVKLIFYSGKGSIPETCILLPFGQISYPEH